MSTLLESIFSVEFFFAVLRVSTPLIFPALGVAITAMSGNINIGLEGIMLIAAFTGVIVSIYTESLMLALLAGVASGIFFGAALGYFHLKLKADIILAAVALNFLASGLTIFLLIVITGGRNTSALRSLTFPSFHIPVLRSIPVLGPILSGHNIMTYVAFLSVFVYYVVMFKTPLGLRIRAVGQNPDAARSVGINVDRVKLYALMISGVFGALGGLYLSMGYVSWFSRDMVAGRGFIAVAAATMGGNLSFGTLLGSMLFGLVNTATIYISSLDIPSDLVQSIPYLATVIVLAIYSARNFAPRKRKAGSAHHPENEHHEKKP
ncbi:MAG: ABC transporter permease [Spirochaetaceae bacterium]|nr:MAG: ABC transporter permease [Spirochaetaceae bacterium]